MNALDQEVLEIARRTFFFRSTAYVGTAALATLLKPSMLRAMNGKVGAPWRGVADPRHLVPRAKRVIFLYQAGGPSHLETFDYKPKLADMDGQPMPESLTKGQPIAQLQGEPLKCLSPQFKFDRYGESGQQICQLFPKIGSIADDIAIVRSLTTEQINHDPAHTFMNTGTSISGRPSLGSWLVYGLGVESEDLPGFVVLTSQGKGTITPQPISSRQWHSGFLPSRFQGVEFRSTGDPVMYVGNPPGVTRNRQRNVIDAATHLNRLYQQAAGDPEVATRITQFEMAFKMQASVPDLVDISDEPQHVLDMYGTKGADGSFAANCLLARRLAERGVRFIQLYHRAWDHHAGIKKNMEIASREVDQASAALIQDLKLRGLFDDTLVVWGGEFGRTPMAQVDGRDHHIRAFSMWMAGGGIQGGITFGTTDELGYNAVENVVHVRDFHATMLYLMGIDDEQLTYKFQGLDFRLTGVEPSRVVEDILV